MKLPSFESTLSFSKKTLSILPKFLGGLSIAINTVCSTGIVAGVTHKMTDGESTRYALDAMEAVIGEQGIRKVGSKIVDGAQYLGEGVVGVGQTMHDRYATNTSSTMIVPPISGPSMVAQSVLLAKSADLSVDHLNEVRAEKDTKNSFSLASREDVPQPAIPNKADVRSVPAKPAFKTPI